MRGLAPAASAARAGMRYILPLLRRRLPLSTHALLSDAGGCGPEGGELAMGAGYRKRRSRRPLSARLSYSYKTRASKEAVDEGPPHRPRSIRRDLLRRSALGSY